MATGRRGDAKPFTTIAVIVFSVIALLQLRFIPWAPRRLDPWRCASGWGIVGEMRLCVMRLRTA
jgi:hypothetical protein